MDYWALTTLYELSKAFLVLGGSIGCTLVRIYNPGLQMAADLQSAYKKLYIIHGLKYRITNNELYFITINGG